MKALEFDCITFSIYIWLALTENFVQICFGSYNLKRRFKLQTTHRLLLIDYFTSNLSQCKIGRIKLSSKCVKRAAIFHFFQSRFFLIIKSKISLEIETNNNVKKSYFITSSTRSTRLISPTSRNKNFSPNLWCPIFSAAGDSSKAKNQPRRYQYRHKFIFDCIPMISLPKR